jgi:hypothetical protein
MFMLQFCHSGLDPESIFFNMLYNWMPDQVRHDGQKISDFLLGKAEVFRYQFIDIRHIRPGPGFNPALGQQHQYDYCGIN